MHHLKELFKPVYDSFSSHINSLDLIGSALEKSDLDVICLFKPHTSISVYKLAKHELNLLGKEHGRIIDPYFAPIDFFKRKLPVTSIDFMMQSALKISNIHLFGKEIGHKLPGTIEEEIWKHQNWLATILYLTCLDMKESDERATQQYLSLLSSLAVVARKVPSSTWHSKRQRLTALGSAWQQDRKSVLALAQSILQDNVGCWHQDPSVQFIKPAFGSHGPYFKSDILLTPEELDAWTSLQAFEELTFVRPYQRINSVLLQLKDSYGKI